MNHGMIRLDRPFKPFLNAVNIVIIQIPELYGQCGIDCSQEQKRSPTEAIVNVRKHRTNQADGETNNVHYPLNLDHC